MKCKPWTEFHKNKNRIFFIEADLQKCARTNRQSIANGKGFPAENRRWMEKERGEIELSKMESFFAAARNKSSVTRTQPD